MKKPAPLPTRLRQALALLRDWKIALRESHIVRANRPSGAEKD